MSTPPPSSSFVTSSSEGSFRMRTLMSVHKPTAQTEARGWSLMGVILTQAISCSRAAVLREQGSEGDEWRRKTKKKKQRT